MVRVLFAFAAAAIIAFRPGDVRAGKADPASPESDFARDLEALCLNPAENHDAFKNAARARGYRQVEKAHGNNRPTDPRLASAWQRIDGSADLRIMTLRQEVPVFPDVLFPSCVGTAKGLDTDRMRMAIEALDGLTMDAHTRRLLEHRKKKPDSKFGYRVRGHRYYTTEEGMRLNYMPNFYDRDGNPAYDYLTIWIKPLNDRDRAPGGTKATGDSAGQ